MKLAGINIISGFAGSREVQLDAAMVRSLIKKAASKLWAVIEPYGLRLRPNSHDPAQCLDDVEGLEHALR